ncbi:hypothetical protein [Fluviibacter sp.]
MTKKSTPTMMPISQLDWRTKLAYANGQFRINGTYDIPTTGRRLRRSLERAAKKGGKQ